jgi:FkbM family methyltransferase
VNAWAVRLRAAWVRRVLRRPIRFRDRYGVRYLLGPGDDLALYMTHRGWFEVAEQEWVRRYLRPGMTAVDVGAYIGVYTLLMARLVGPSGRVHAFEPSPATHRRLVEHVALNRLANVVASRQAVFSGPGHASLACFGPPFESLSRLGGADAVRGGQVLAALGEADVETVALDAYCAAQAVRRVDLLKLDAEGAEAEVLAGAAGLLAAGAVGACLVEIGPTFPAVRARLEAHGFRLYAPDRHGGLDPLGADPGVPNAVALHGTADGLDRPADL